MLLFHPRLFALARDLRAYVASGLLLGLAITAGRVAQALLLAHAVAAAVVDGRTPSTQLAWLAAVVVIRAGLIWCAEIAAHRTSGAAKERLRTLLYGRLLALGPGHLMRTRSGQVRSVLVDGVEAVESYFARYLPAVGTALLGPVAMLVIMAVFDPWIALIVLAGAAVAVGGSLLWMAAFHERSDQVWAAIGETDAEFVDTVQGLPTLKAFNATERRRAFIAERSEWLRQAVMGQLRYGLMHEGIRRTGTLGGAAAATVYAVAAYPGLSAYSLLAVVFLVPEAFRPLDSLGQYAHQAMGGVSAAKGIDDLMNAEEPTPEAAGAAPDGPAASVAFEDVTFSYPGRDEPALRSVSLEVRPGETVAVVGESGSGKTTLAALLLRFMEPASGRVLVGGRDVREIPLAALRGMFGFVAQDTYLFHGTVAENIAFGRADATREEVAAAARAAGLDGLDLDTVAGERGQKLSGGQRQRIALARALLKDAPILILDEATSSVDGATEEAILRTLRAAREGRTTLVIAHRLSTVRDADRIVVLDGGEIVESGTHEELRALGNGYARLIAAQEDLMGVVR